MSITQWHHEAHEEITKRSLLTNYKKKKTRTLIEVSCFVSEVPFIHQTGVFTFARRPLKKKGNNAL